MGEVMSNTHWQGSRSQGVEHAKSARSKCRVCSAKIDKGAVRISIEINSTSHYFHKDCVTYFPARISKGSDFDGYDNLDSKEQDDLNEHIEKTQEKNPPKDDEELPEEPDEPSSPVPSEEYKEEEEYSNEEPASEEEFSDYEDSKRSTRSTRTTRSKSKATSKSKSKSTTASKSKSKRKADGKKGGSKRALTAAEKKEEKEIEEISETLQDHKVKDLREMLKKNSQPFSGGNKADVIYRVAEGKVRGALPKCPKCYTATLKFDRKARSYRCPGYMDDEDFHRCSYKSDTAEREKWVD